jgi:hypothetical protein
VVGVGTRCRSLKSARQPHCRAEEGRPGRGRPSEPTRLCPGRLNPESRRSIRQTAAARRSRRHARNLQAAEQNRRDGRIVRTNSASHSSHRPRRCGNPSPNTANTPRILHTKTDAGQPPEWMKREAKMCLDVLIWPSSSRRACVPWRRSKRDTPSKRNSRPGLPPGRPRPRRCRRESNASCSEFRAYLPAF